MKKRRMGLGSLPLVKDLRAALGYWSLPPTKRALVQQVIASGAGMHGEAFRFFEDGLCTIHNADFISESGFQRAYAAGEATGSWKGWALRWRAYVVCWCAQWAGRIGGDFIECGVNRGGNARMIIEYLGLTDKSGGPIFYLLDTFEGFAEDLLLPEEKGSVVGGYRYPNCLDAVRDTFKSYPFVRIIPGAVPSTLKEVQSTRVAFLSIDMNCVEPEIAAATFLWDRLLPGGVVVLDDYGFSRHHLQKGAFDRFASTRSVQVLSLPTGQGLIFKPLT